MIRTARIPTAQLSGWLASLAVAPGAAQYRLRLWEETPASFVAVADHLKTYFDEAFEDARRTLRRGFEDDLSPFNERLPDPAANFPALLHRVTLQGYLGETLAAIAVEHWGAHSADDWHVPAFLFRFHVTEFQHLEIINELLAEGGIHSPDAGTQRRPGRTGDDCLAFRMDAAQTIVAVLTVESKCLGKHRSDKLKEAHEKLAVGTNRPPGIHELINLLSEYDTPAATTWRTALRKLWYEAYRAVGRYDGVTYVSGDAPKGPERKSWISDSKAHVAYTAKRPLEAMEFHLDVDQFVDKIFRGK